jgi:hypothetical protein
VAGESRGNGAATVIGGRLQVLEFDGARGGRAHGREKRQAWQACGAHVAIEADCESPSWRGADGFVAGARVSVASSASQGPAQTAANAAGGDRLVWCRGAVNRASEMGGGGGGGGDRLIEEGDAQSEVL